MFFLPFSAKHALYQLRDVTQYILALGGLAVSNPGYVVFIIYGPTYEPLKWKGDGYIKLLFQVSSSMPGRFIKPS